MVEITLLSIAILVLILSAFFLARSKRSSSHNEETTYNKSESISYTKPFIRQKRLSRSLDKFDKYDEKDASPFDNKYDELVYLFKNGEIDEAEYYKQLKDIMN